MYICPRASVGHMLTIAVMNFKGGVGKTTLSILLANELAQRGHRVLLSDCDPQNSALAWQSWAKSNLMVERVEKIRPKKTERSDVDMNVLDCPPRYGDQCIAAAIAADVALIPVMPGPLDYAATGMLVETLREANKRRTSPLPALLVANRTMPRSVVSRLLVETLNKLAAQVDGAPRRDARPADFLSHNRPHIAALRPRHASPGAATRLREQRSIDYPRDAHVASSTFAAASVYSFSLARLNRAFM